jgi:hypothetical protein
MHVTRSPSATPPTPSPPPFDMARSLVFAIGVGAPVAIAVWTDMLHFGVFAGIGAFWALMTDPRRSPAVRLIALPLAALMMFGAAYLGVRLQDHPDAATVLAIALVVPIGMIPPSLRWISIVAKLVPIALLFTCLGFTPNRGVGEGFMTGALVATLVSMIESWLRKSPDPGTEPLSEVLALWRGASNDLPYALALAFAAAISIVAAMSLGTSRPVWALVTALFVMHPEGVVAVQRIRARIGGTLTGVLLAGLIVHVTHSAWMLTLLSIALAALYPAAMTRGFFASSAVATLFVLILLDVGWLGVGGDMSLIVARFIDTLIGCGAVAISIFALRRWYAWRGKEDKAPDGEPVEPGPGSPEMHAGADIEPDVHP